MIKKKITNIENHNIISFKEKESEKEEKLNIISSIVLQNEIKSKIFYIQLKTVENEIHKYSLSKAHWKNININYKCSDTNCESRLYAKFELNNNNIIKIISYETKKTQPKTRRS